MGLFAELARVFFGNAKVIVQADVPSCPRLFDEFGSALFSIWAVFDALNK